MNVIRRITSKHSDSDYDSDSVLGCITMKRKEIMIEKIESGDRRMNCHCHCKKIIIIG